MSQAVVGDCNQFIPFKQGRIGKLYEDNVNENSTVLEQTS